MSRLTETTSPSLFARVATRFAAWRRHRNEMAELASMSARDLADIGVTRGDLAAIAKGTFENARTLRQGVTTATRKTTTVAATRTRAAA